MLLPRETQKQGCPTMDPRYLWHFQTCPKWSRKVCDNVACCREKFSTSNKLVWSTPTVRVSLWIILTENHALKYRAKNKRNVKSSQFSSFMLVSNQNRVLTLPSYKSRISSYVPVQVNDTDVRKKAAAKALATERNWFHWDLCALLIGNNRKLLKMQKYYLHKVYNIAQ